jgi:hypothetical protein
MASIWTQGPGSPAKKLKGHIPAKPHLVREQLAKYAGRLAHCNGAAIVLDEPWEIHLQWPDGVRFTVFAELASPPSAPEEGQPKLAGQRGIVMVNGEAHALKVPQ